MLQVASITKSVDEQRALDSVGSSLRAGEVLGVIGPNGAGKTTLLEAIAGLLHAFRPVFRDAGRMTEDRGRRCQRPAQHGEFAQTPCK